MKIMIVHPYWQYEEVAFMLPSLLSERGTDVHVVVWDGETKRVSASRNPSGFNVVRLPGINASPVRGSVLPVAEGLCRVIKEISPDVVDCQSHLFPISLQSVLCCRRLGVPSIVTVNGFKVKRGFIFNLLQSAYINTFSRLIFQISDAVRCLTKSDASEVVKHGCNPEKISIIPNGVDTSIFKSSHPKNPRRIAWVGRFVNEKDLPTLIRAARLVVDEFDDACFVLVGEGPIRGRVESMVCDLGLESNFKFTGRVSRERVAEILRDSSVFALPSLREGLPFSLLEAMSCGNAVIGSDIPGINSVIREGETGFLFAPGDHVALSKKLSSLLRDHALAGRIGENAAKEAQAKYSMPAVVDQLMGLYRRVSGKARGE